MLIETIIANLQPYIQNKTVLEIACGETDFSINAAKYAKSVLATDISLDRIKKRNVNLPKNLTLKEMDATNLQLADEEFDVVGCYNALGHLPQLDKVLEEMIRVTKVDGLIIFIATWKMDKAILNDLQQTITEIKQLSIINTINNKYQAIIVQKKR